MKYTDNALNILTIKSYKGIGNSWIVKNITKELSIDEIINLLNKKLPNERISEYDFISKKNIFRDIILEKLNDYCDGFIALGDKDFPQYRGNVKDSERPVFLYYKGDINLLSHNNNKVSVIGLLNPDEEIQANERLIVKELIYQGATIISGLALGCDSIAHHETLNNNGKTVAILPSPLNNILPSSNKKLAFDIVENGGLLITEYGNNFRNQFELSSRYKERDRLQALFCDTIILAASYSILSNKIWNILDKKLDSGARLAMEYAKEYGIPRGVIYDEKINKENPMFDLNREIIDSSKSKNIFIINNKNYKEEIKKIIKLNQINKPQDYQDKLFK